MLTRTTLTAAVLLTSLFASSFSIAAPEVAQAAERTISFSGYTWTVRGDWWSGPGPNSWNNDEQAVFVDDQGRLHLKISYRNGAWYSSEVYLPTSLGYGTYQFDIESPLNEVDTNTVASPFLYQDDTHEFDIEFSDWRSPGTPKGQFVIQPGALSGNVSRYEVTGATGLSSHLIHWTPNNVFFRSAQGTQTLHEWDYRGSGNFVPGQERLHINFWMIAGLAPSSGQEQEIIINHFTFTPYSGFDGPTAGPTAVTSPAAPLIEAAPAPEPVRVCVYRRKRISVYPYYRWVERCRYQ